MEKILFCSGNGEKTDGVEDCDNFCCGFNVIGKCTATGTECFGYIEPKEPNEVT